MASVYTAVLNKFIAKTLLTARARMLATRLVNMDLDPVEAGRGEVINVPFPSRYVAKAVVPGVNPVEGDPANPVTMPLTLNEWWDVSTEITDKQLGEISDGVFSSEQDGMMLALVEAINASIYKAGNKFYNVAGTAGTNPFATNEDPLLEAIRLLDENRAPVTDRFGVIKPSSKSKALKIDNITRYDARGQENGAKITGVFGNAYGVELLMDQLLYLHTSTALTAGAATANGVNAVGAGSTDGGRTGTISINKITNASDLVAGDVLVLAGQTQTYRVVTGVTLAVGNTTVTIAPALTTATAGAEAITLIASSKSDLVFHRDAITFASRPVKGLKGAGNIERMTDPITGLTVTAEIVRHHYQSKLQMSSLWGVDSFRPEWGVRLLGTIN